MQNGETVFETKWVLFVHIKAPWPTNFKKIIEV